MEPKDDKPTDLDGGVRGSLGRHQGSEQRPDVVK
jgi:hypothetical protein